MNVADLVQVLTAPRRADAARYPTAYAIDFALANRAAFVRATGVVPARSYNESSQRQAMWDAIIAYAEQQGIGVNEVEVALADAYLEGKRLVLA